MTEQSSAANRQESLRPVVGVPDRHTFSGVVKLTYYYGGEVQIDVGDADLSEFLERLDGRQVRIEVIRYA